MSETADSVPSVAAASNDAKGTPSDCLIVIFGASGDLAKRKLIPALYYLWDKGQAPQRFAVLGVSRTKFSDDDWRQVLHDFMPEAYDQAKWKQFAQCIHYQPADATKADHWPTLKQRIQAEASNHQTGSNTLFYLSMAPQFFEPIIDHIGQSGLVTEGREFCSLTDSEDQKPWQRIIVEKPFGSDPASARHLNDVLNQYFDEQSIYRIDHYLGKELVQNLLVLRFANVIFEPIWNQRYVDHVQITASERIPLEGRSDYYDGPAGGALRDMVQSHLLQVLSLTAMEPPISLEAEDVRTEKVKVFKALHQPRYQDVPDIAVRGQYGAGELGDKQVHAYRDNEGVNPQSQTDTFAAVKLGVDTWRWGGVPFYLRSGKAMAEKKTEIVIYFKQTPHRLFREHGKTAKPNQIAINIQPNEGIRMRFEGKVPGLGMHIRPVVMDFDYAAQWQVEPPDGYALLLSDCLRGDLTNYKHRDEVEASWRAVQPILDYWQANPQSDLPNYRPGSWGPEAAHQMMARAGRYWRND